jgi:hypothetical protein
MMNARTAIGTLTPAPAMSEEHVRDALADMPSPYRIPTDWRGEDSTVIAFTHDPVMAALAADTLARRDLGAEYPPVMASGLLVEGPCEVVLTSPVDASAIEWRPAGADDDYALLMCLVRPAPTRHLNPGTSVDADLVDASARSWGWQ